MHTKNTHRTHRSKDHVIFLHAQRSSLLRCTQHFPHVYNGVASLQYVHDEFQLVFSHTTFTRPSLSTTTASPVFPLNPKMKLLEVYDFEQLCSQLNHDDDGGVRIESALEAFSCKPGSDRKLYKSLDKSMDDMYNDPAPQGKSQGGSEAFGTSPFGPMTDTSSRKTFIFLVATLNGVFPDYDFSNLKVEDFRDESNLFLVVNAVNTRLQSCPHFSGDLQEKLWSTLDREILLKECEVYSFLPDPDSDPFFEEGSIWNVNYFFYNRKLKRVVFFQCRAIRASVTMGSGYSMEGPKADEMGGNDWGNDTDLDFMME